MTDDFEAANSNDEDKITEIIITDSEETVGDILETEVEHKKKPVKDNATKNPNVCNICNKVFSKKFSLKTHYLIHAKVKPFICEICYKTFSRISTLNVHSLIHTGKRSFLCEICDKRFARKTDLQKHFFIHSGESPYACKTCEKRFNNQSNLRRHAATHTKIKPHVCDICRQTFSQKEVLLNHLKNHYMVESVKDGEKPDKERLAIRNYLKRVIKKNFYPCDKCDKIFVRNDRLKKHKQTHSSNWGLTHICEVCNARFKCKEDLQEHLLNHIVLTLDFDNPDEIDSAVVTNVQTAQKPKNDHKCLMCFKTFTRKASLENHYLIHSGEKPHKCTFCNKTFSQKITLKRHLLIHTGERPFMCKICNKGFARNSTLRKHYISHSATNLF